MLDYLYDGTFEGLLTCIYHHYYTDRASDICRRSCYQPNLLGGYLEVETDELKAVTVYEAIERKISTYDRSLSTYETISSAHWRAFFLLSSFIRLYTHFPS